MGLDTKVGIRNLCARRPPICRTDFLFNRSIIDATKDVAAVFKVQIAFYEAYGLAGMKAYMRTVRYLKEKDCLVSRVKRGDISSTAQMYAKAHFEGDFAVDFVTLNRIWDLIRWMRTGRIWRQTRGVYARCYQSGAADLRDCQWKTELRCIRVADGLQEYIGAAGYSALGVVFGGTQKTPWKNPRAMAICFSDPGYGGTRWHRSVSALSKRMETAVW